MKKEFEQFGILTDDISDENVDFNKLQEAGSGEDEDGEENNLSDFVVDCLDNLDIKLYKFYLKEVNIQEKFFL